MVLSIANTTAHTLTDTPSEVIAASDVVRYFRVANYNNTGAGCCIGLDNATTSDFYLDKYMCRMLTLPAGKALYAVRYPAGAGTCVLFVTPQ